MTQQRQERPKRPSTTAQAEIELAIFLMDGSGSMCKPDEGAIDTYDGRKKEEHLVEIVQSTLETMYRSSKRDAFRVSLIHFSEEAEAEEVEVREAKTTYFPVEDALEVLKPPSEVTQGGLTSIVAALSKAREVLDAVNEDVGLPTNKFATVFLLTDGHENMQSAQEVYEELGKLHSHGLSPTMATVSFGMDTDEQLLLDIANEPSERQVRHLELAGVLGEIYQEPRKLFLRGHSDGEVTEAQAKAIRNFLNVLSMTIEQQD
jgi:Mg-chelatase subunit ChlD